GLPRDEGGRGPAQAVRRARGAQGLRVVFISHLELADFRNYESASLALAPGPNLIVGSNGQGKTNLVESVAYLATLGSHRVSSDQALIRQGQDAAIVRLNSSHVKIS